MSYFKPIAELKFGNVDAESNKSSTERELFNNAFYEDDTLKQIKKPNTFFVLGDKGTGKTAYATFLRNQNQERSNLHTEIHQMDSTGYQKFVRLKNETNAFIDDYCEIWKEILLLLLAETIRREEGAKLGTNRSLIKLGKFLDDKFESSIVPTITKAITVIEKNTSNVHIVSKALGIEGDLSSGSGIDISYGYETFADSFEFINKVFISTLQEITYSKEYLLFIDGIDIRPRHISFVDYIDCISGLAQAVWQLNVDSFQPHKKARKLRIVLLLRPDVFEELDLRNIGSKLMDNSVVLNWVTPYKYYRRSSLFKMADKLLQAQHVGLKNDQGKTIKKPTFVDGECWDHYFPYRIPHRTIKGEEDDSFIDFLRYSLHRPRDIIALLSIIRDNCPPDKVDVKTESVFPKVDFSNELLQRDFKKYLTNEIKENLVFYHDRSSFTVFREFFRFLKKNMKSNDLQFSYSQFEKAYYEFCEYCVETRNWKLDSPIYRTVSDFLQTLFELNILAYLGYREEKGVTYTNQYWYFRERTTANVSPEVRLCCDYKLHSSLSVAFDITEKMFPDDYD